ncbi:repa, partial [Clostridioides difficile]
MPLCKIDLSPLYQKPPKQQGKQSLEEAKELYPEWYLPKIVEGKHLKTTWTCNTDLYEGWKGKMDGDVKVGGRYFTLMAFCAYGLICGISEEQKSQVANDLLERTVSLCEDRRNHFITRYSKNDMEGLKL